MGGVARAGRFQGLIASPPPVDGQWSAAPPVVWCGRVDFPLFLLIFDYFPRLSLEFLIFGYIYRISIDFHRFLLIFDDFRAPQGGTIPWGGRNPWELMGPYHGGGSPEPTTPDRAPDLQGVGGSLTAIWR